MGVKFYLTFDPSKQWIFVSLPAEKLILKVDVSTNTTKINRAVGNGNACKGNGICGDGSSALDAKLTYPKVKYISIEGLLNNFSADILGLDC